MALANPLFVRCLKPNNDRCPMKFDMPVVLEQIRYLVSYLFSSIDVIESFHILRLPFFGVSQALLRSAIVFPI